MMNKQMIFAVRGKSWVLGGKPDFKIIPDLIVFSHINSGMSLHSAHSYIMLVLSFAGSDILITPVHYVTTLQKAEVKNSNL